MKLKLLIIMILLAILTTSANFVPLMRLEIWNQSKVDAHLKLEEISIDDAFYSGAFYYLPAEASNGVVPTVKTYTLVRAMYSGTLYYCNQPEPSYFRYDFTKANHKIVLSCVHKLTKSGEGVTKINPLSFPVIPGEPYTYDLIDWYRYRY